MFPLLTFTHILYLSEQLAMREACKYVEEKLAVKVIASPFNIIIFLKGINNYTRYGMDGKLFSLNMQELDRINPTGTACTGHPVHYVMFLITVFL